MGRTFILCPNCKGTGNIEVEVYQCEICSEATKDVYPARLGLERNRVGHFPYYWRVTKLRYRVFHRSGFLSERKRQ